MATLRINWKLAAVNNESNENHPKKLQVRYTISPRIHEEYHTQMSEDIEGRVTKMSQEYSRTGSRILGALS